MTQLGEPVTIGMVDADELNCPFDHSNAEPPEVENQLIGNGGKLATKMGNGTSTHLYAPLVNSQSVVKNPRDDPAHSLYGHKTPVVVIVHDGLAAGERIEHRYPVTCAAHHLIPSQESLKTSRLLAFMVKKGSTEKLKDKEFSSGAVWADVGYETNGSENGVYLPGSYAVGGGRGGMGVWTENDDQPDSEEEEVAGVPDPTSPSLDGDLNEISERNRKWRYVRQAMFYGKGQFHDRHESYSKFVGEVLNKMFSDYRRMYQKSVKEQACPKCKDKADKIKELGIPTPFGLVGRLNGLSRNLQTCLNGSVWRPNVFTSKWGDAFMREAKSENPAARLTGAEKI
ncbi:hypothetical protein BH11PSE9_BH11PSE9_04280 [soil metagenome]